MRPREIRSYFTRQVVLVVLIQALCGCLSGCTQPDRTTEGRPEKITIAYGTPPSTALADVAQVAGYFHQQGLEATPHFHPSGMAALNEVLEGKADIATVAETPVMFAVMKGRMIFITASSTYRVTLDQSLLFTLEDETRWAMHNELAENVRIPDYLDYIYLDGLMSVKPKVVRIVR